MFKWRLFPLLSGIVETFSFYGYRYGDRLALSVHPMSRLGCLYGFPHFGLRVGFHAGAHFHGVWTVILRVDQVHLQWAQPVLLWYDGGCSASCCSSNRYLVLCCAGGILAVPDRQLRSMKVFKLRCVRWAGKRRN